MEIKEFFEPVLNFIKGFQKKEKEPASKQAAKDRLKLVLMQDRASVSPDFFELMKQEIIDVIKKYIEIDEESLEVELARGFESGLEGPALYANIPIKNVKPVAPKSEESAALSEEEADKLADEILDNIEAASAGASTGASTVASAGAGSTNDSESKIEEETKDSGIGLKSVFGPESEELLRRVLKERPVEETEEKSEEGSEEKQGGVLETEENEEREKIEVEEEEKETEELVEELSSKTSAKKKTASSSRSAGTKAATSTKKSTTAKSTKTTTRKKKSE